MSSTLSEDPPSPAFKLILDAGFRRSLSEYKKKTGKPLFDDLLQDSLAIRLQRCDSVDTIKAIFQSQADAFQRVGDGDQWRTWINPLVDALSAFSGTIRPIASLVRP
jgi:hypothetical protein